MVFVSRLVATGLLAATLASAGLGAPQASAHDEGAGVLFGIASGLVIGDVLAHQRREEWRRYHEHMDQGRADEHAAIRSYFNGPAPYYGPGPSCYPGPLQWRWQQVCQPGAYGQLYCQNVKTYYQPQICN